MKLDQNFTDADEARKIVESLTERIDPTRTRRYIEPSCGKGAFVDALVSAGIPREHICAIEIDPTLDADVHGDFLTMTMESCWNPATTVVIGNPPFGRSGRTARAFINKGCDYGKCIGFVLPRSMHGANCCTTLNPRLELLREELLPRTFEGTDAKCNWQEWFLLASGQTGFRPTEPTFDSEGLYELVTAEAEWNVAIQRVGGNAGSVVSGEGAACNKYFIRSQYPEVLRAFRNLGRHEDVDMTVQQRSLSAPRLQELLDRQLLAQYKAQLGGAR